MKRNAWLTLLVSALGALMACQAAAQRAGNGQPRRDPARAYSAAEVQSQGPRGGRPATDLHGPHSNGEGWSVPSPGDRPDRDRPDGDKPGRDKPDGDKPGRDKPPTHDDHNNGGPPPGRPGHGGPGHGDGGGHGWWGPDRPSWGLGPSRHHRPHYWGLPGYYPNFYYYYGWYYPRYWDYPNWADDEDESRGDWDNYDTAYPPDPQLLGRIVGAEIWAADGTYLGVIDPDRKNKDSICNSDGEYGSFYSSTSILNPRSDYGAGKGELSCWDPTPSTPPRLFWHGRFVGYLSTNRDLHPRTDPAWVLERWLPDARAED